KLDGIKTLPDAVKALVVQIIDLSLQGAQAARNVAQLGTELDKVRQAGQGGQGSTLPPLPQGQFNARFGQPFAKSSKELFPDLFRARDEAAKAAERAAREQSTEAAKAAKEAADRLNEAVANQTKVAVDIVTGMLGQQENINRGSINAFLKRGG